MASCSWTCSAGWCRSSLWNDYTEGMHYELWDTESRNLLDDFDTEAEALAAIRALLVINEPEMAHALALLRVGGPGGGALVAQGSDLAARARSATAGREPHPA